MSNLPTGAVLPLLIRLLAVFLALSVPVAALDGSLFSFHPTFMALGFLGFMAEAVLTSISFRTLEGPARTAAIQRHMLWQIASISCVVLGFIAIEGNKIWKGKGHFHSWHSKVGFGTVFLSYAAALGGMLSFRKLGFLTRLPERWHGPVKTAHRYLGMATWLLGLIAAELMMTHRSIDKGGAVLSWFWRAATGLLGALMLVLAVVTRPPATDKYSALEADVQLAQVQHDQQQRV